MLEAGRHQQADARPLALDQRVGAERGRVAHRIHLRQQRGYANLELLARIGERLVEAERQVVVCRERLALDVPVVPDDEAVGEGAADIHGYAFHGKYHGVFAPRVECADARVAAGLSKRQMPAAAAFGALPAILPLRAQSVDVELNIVQRWMPRRQVLGFDHRAALRAVVLEDPAPGRIRRIGALVFRGIEQWLVDLARIAVVDQKAALVVFARVAQLPIAASAFPALGIKVDAQVFRDGHFHVLTPFNFVSRKSPELESSKRQPASMRDVKNASSTTIGPSPEAPPASSAAL